MAGGSHHGFWYRLLDRPDGPSYDSDYCPKKVPMGQFFNNTVHSSGRFGLWIFPGYTPSYSRFCSFYYPTVAKFEYLTAYLNDKGAEWETSSNLQFRNFLLFDNAEAGIETKNIVFYEDLYFSTSFYSSELGSKIADTIIIGNSNTAASTSITPTGLIFAWDRGQLVTNLSFYNFPDSSSRAMSAPIIIGRCLYNSIYVLNHICIMLCLENVTHNHHYLLFKVRLWRLDD